MQKHASWFPVIFDTVHMSRWWHREEHPVKIVRKVALYLWGRVWAFVGKEQVHLSGDGQFPQRG